MFLPPGRHTTPGFFKGFAGIELKSSYLRGKHFTAQDGSLALCNAFPGSLRYCGYSHGMDGETEAVIPPSSEYTLQKEKPW